jgi:iron complex outermembrane receptor protein
MLKLKPVARGVALAFGGSVAFLATASPALAQQQSPPAQAQPQTLDAAVVTGTRIRTPDAVSNSPIFTIGSDTIQLDQPVSAEELIRNLPQAIPGVGSGTNNGSGGGATIDLRGLGTNRSLVLINGRRATPFDLDGVVDVNTVPIPLLQRTDVITGGASAVYGADAVAGVVNFVLNRRFKGLEAGASFGQTSEGDGDRASAHLTMGAGFDNDRGNVVLSIGATKTDPVLQGDRSYGQVSRSSTTGRPQGSATTVPTVEGNIIGGQINPATGLFGPNIETFNFNPLNLYQSPLSRTQLSAMGTYEINSYAEVYADAFFSKNKVKTQLAPSGTFFNDFSVPLGNPYLTPGARQQLCTEAGLTSAECAENDRELVLGLGRRFVELGPRLNDFETTTNQFTFGVKGNIVGPWTYDVYGQLGESDQVQSRKNWGSNSRVQQALRALSTTECLDPSNGCVPLNVFGAAGSISRDQLRFINLDAVLTQTVRQQVWQGSVSGDLGQDFKAPWTKLPIALSVGGEYRKLSASQFADQPSTIQGEVLGTGAPAPNFGGEFNFNELFTEFNVPLVTDAPMAKNLTLDAGYRYTKFELSNNSDNYDSYKFGGTWTVIDGLRVRSQYQRATRAPGVNELFEPATTALNNLAVDPCQGTRINAAEAFTPGTLSNLCRLTGVPVSRIGSLPAPSAGQVNVVEGGNSTLAPEEADTITFGLQFAPAAVRGLTMGLDWYDIKIKDAIFSRAVDDVLSGCYGSAGFAFTRDCSLIGRNPNSGTFNGAAATGIVTLLGNVGQIRTSGFDVSAGYGFALSNLGADPSWGRIDLGIIATYVTKYEFSQRANGTTRDCRGYYSVACGTVSGGEGPLPKLRFQQRTQWSFSDFRFGYNWRYIGSVEEEPGGTVFFEPYRSIGSQSYFDLTGEWRATKNLRVNLTIVNAFDRDPPVVGNTIGTTAANSGNTFPQTYDSVGRYFTLGATLNF